MFATVDVKRSTSRAPIVCTSSDSGGNSTRFGSGVGAGAPPAGAPRRASAASAVSLVTGPRLIPRLTRMETRERALALSGRDDGDPCLRLPAGGDSFEHLPA